MSLRARRQLGVADGAGPGRQAVENIVIRHRRPTWLYSRNMRYAILVLVLILSGVADVQAEHASKTPASHDVASPLFPAGYSTVNVDRRAIVVLLMLYQLKVDDRLHERLRQQVGRHAQQDRPRAGRNTVAVND